MRFSAIFALATAAVAAPAASWDEWKPADNCLTDERAEYIVSRARTYQLKANLDDARAAGEELYGPDFRQYGDSINSLRGDPPGTLVEPDGATYIENTLSAPPVPQINTLAILHNCTHIYWQWQFIGIGGPTSQYRVNGGVVITVDVNREVQPVVGQYVEFNSIAWALNTGFTVEPPTTGPYAPPPE